MATAGSLQWQSAGILYTYIQRAVVTPVAIRVPMTQLALVEARGEELSTEAIDANWFDLDPPHSTIPAPSLRRFTPMKLHDLGDHFLIRVELPGVDQTEISVQVSPDLVRIRAQRTERVPHTMEAQISERKPLEFDRTFKLYATVDPQAVSACTEHGILSVTLTKTKEPRNSSIPVRAL